MVETSPKAAIVKIIIFLKSAVPSIHLFYEITNEIFHINIQTKYSNKVNQDMTTEKTRPKLLQ